MVRPNRPLLAVFLILASVPLGAGAHLQAQDSEKSASDPLGGALLGASSGTVFGLIGGAAVCNRTLLGSVCPRMAAGLGGAIGGVSGAVLGDRNAGLVDDRLGGAGYGALTGGLIGLGLSRFIRQYGWADVGAFAVVGGAVGASPSGAGLGFGIGAILGTVGLLAIPEMKIGDAIGLSVAGLAVGGLAGWVVGASDAEREKGHPILVIPLEIRF